MKYRPLWLESRQGAFICVRWKVTLCDLIWQVTLHSSDMCSHNIFNITLCIRERYELRVTDL